MQLKLCGARIAPSAKLTQYLINIGAVVKGCFLTAFAILGEEKMDDLISKQAAIEICLKYNGVGWVWSQILDEIEALPSARARWEYVDYGGIGNWHCSACRAISPKKYNFCPACGRDMRGDYQ